jgi:hypothetical protein
MGEGFSEFSFYYYLDAAGKRYMPYFTTEEGAVRYVEERIMGASPEYYMNSLERASDLQEVNLLAGDDYSVRTWDLYEAIDLPYSLDVKVLVRDPGPGPEQTVLELPELEP